MVQNPRTQKVTGRARALVDARAYFRLVNSPMPPIPNVDARLVRAQALMNMALAFEAAGAIESALSATIRMRDMLEAERRDSGSPSRRFYAWAVEHQALYRTVWFGPSEEALGDLRSAREFLLRLFESEGASEEKLRLRGIQMGINEAVVLRALSRFEESSSVCTEILRELPNVGRLSLDDRRARSKAHLVRAQSLVAVKRIEDALTETFYAIVVPLRGLRELPDSLDLLEDVANARLVRAQCLRDLRKTEKAERLVDRAIESVETVVGATPKVHLRALLAQAHRSKSERRHVTGDYRAALKHALVASKLYEGLVGGQGRREYRFALALSYYWAGCAYRDLGATEKAMLPLDRAVSVFTFLVDVDGRALMRGKLAGALGARAANRFLAGDPSAARADVEAARDQIARAKTDGLRDDFPKLERFLERLEEADAKATEDRREGQ